MTGRDDRDQPLSTEQLLERYERLRDRVELTRYAIRRGLVQP